MPIRRIRVRLHDDEFNALARIAEASGRSFNKVMREALRRLADLDDSEE
ncbi:ribbon-helix-helix protein, CopG family [Streptomyces diastatochromogenes]|nr:ribbon-helix-helix protein, CopG family [Streptomyces diastatochromogenes]MCZ0986683.1 ribbon-helix-helix protein, CopG family [Streptomyces diastatochromogenes]